MLTSDYEYKDSRAGTIGQVAASLNEAFSKVWVCEKLITNSGKIQELFVSRTGPRLLFTESDSWSSLFSEDEAGWLDVKEHSLDWPDHINSSRQRRVLPSSKSVEPHR
jgi:hypothetical protein